MDLDYEWTVGKKINSKLVYTNDKHLFRISSKAQSGVIYMCYVTGCSARIKIANDTCSYMAGKSAHIHGSQELSYEQFKLECAMKQRCSKEKKMPQEIYNEACGKNQEVGDTIQYAKRARSLTFHQTRNIPKNPKTVEEAKAFFENVEIMNTIGKTLHKDSKQFHCETVITRSFAYQIFASLTILLNLTDNVRARVDATFKVVPKGPFKQLLIFSIDIENHVSIQN